MAVYRLKAGYRGVNKEMKEGQFSQFDRFYQFKRDDLVEAEEYNPVTVDGVKFAKGMMLVSGAFIVPANFLVKLEGEALRAALAEKGIEIPEDVESQALPVDEANVVNVADMPEDKASLFDVTEIGEKAINMGKGALIGGILGVLGGYALKKKYPNTNLWLAATIGVSVGAIAVLVYNSIKKNEGGKGASTKNAEKIQQEVNNSLDGE
jgi:hypothetical protein